MWGRNVSTLTHTHPYTHTCAEIVVLSQTKTIVLFEMNLLRPVFYRGNVVRLHNAPKELPLLVPLPTEGILKQKALKQTVLKRKHFQGDLP